MKYTDIIWDFNGTIIDDVEAGIISVNKMLAERSLPIIADKEAYRRVFRFPIIEYYRSLGFDFESEPYETVLAPMWVNLYKENSKHAPMQEGVCKAIDLFSSKGLHQHILSASEIGILTEQLRSFGIYEKFDSVTGLDNIHAHSKTALALEWRKNHPDAVALFIGDTEHDAGAAKTLGADCALISFGHQSKETLEKCERAFVFESLEELINKLFE